MIIKSMARKSPSFGQLINYFHKEKFWKKAPTYSHNMWETNKPERIAEEFEKNHNFQIVNDTALTFLAFP